MNETPQIGMDQLSYFVDMMKDYLVPELREHFWITIRENCPDLMQAIEGRFLTEMRAITFTRDLVSPAFDPHLVFGHDDHSEQTEEEECC
jgi:hypothetical protein